METLWAVGLDEIGAQGAGRTLTTDQEAEVAAHVLNLSDKVGKIEIAWSYAMTT